MDELFAYPIVTLASATNLLRVTPRAAQSNIDKLIAERILTEITGRQRNRIYAASRLIEVVEADKA